MVSRMTSQQRSGWLTLVALQIWGIANKLISIFNAYVNSIALERISWKY